MRYFYDTEFYENGKTIRLISIGIVAADGREYYAETVDAPVLCSASPWLMQNVLLNLKGPRKRSAEIAMDVKDFMEPGAEIWANWGAYDWVCLCQLYGTMMNTPEWPYYQDINDLCRQRGLTKKDLPEQRGFAHNALEDARWNRDVYDFVESYDRALTSFKG